MSDDAHTFCSAGDCARVIITAIARVMRAILISLRS
jgi:hypothetical protein